jgi:hypothetical protein
MTGPISQPRGFTGVLDSAPGARLRDTAQFKLNDQGGLVSVSTNKAGRFFNWLTRGDAGKQANRAATHAYIDHVRSKYGAEAGFMATSALTDRIERGNPLSMRAIRAIEHKLQTLSAEGGVQAKDLEVIGDLGSGSNNQVRSVHFKLDGRQMTGALKEVPVSSGLALLMRDEVIQEQANSLDFFKTPTFVLDRNLATERLADRLGMPVIAHSLASQSPEGQPALIMELVHGDTAQDRITNGTPVVDGGELRRGLVGLQVTDFLTAQFDRNMSNIMLKKEGGRDIPVGIDNDICFISSRSADDWPINAQAQKVGLPMVLDHAMRDAIMALTADDIKAIMGSNLAVGQRLESAVARLETLQAHLNSSEVLLVGNGQWNTPAVHDQLTKHPDNYWHHMMHPA